MHAGIPPPRTRTPREQTPPRPDPRDQTSPGSRPPTPLPGKQTPGYAQRAAGTHPTGMHSCLKWFHLLGPITQILFCAHVCMGVKCTAYVVSIIYGGNSEQD